MEAPSLPTTFPCWVKAIYSFGGETKRDLGFLEGDYIECLNAGDGSWWTGRLKRDPRMVGKFPSNFVKVLDQSSLPATRNASPLPARNDSTPPSSGQNTPISAKRKTGFRRPFSAHAAAAAPNPQAAARNVQSRSSTPISKKSTTRPYASMKKPEPVNHEPSVRPTRPPSPKIPQPIARGGFRKPLPAIQRVESHQHDHIPIPPIPQRPTRPPTPLDDPSDELEMETESSPPPPPPPAHRIAYTRHPSEESPVTEPPERSYTPYRPPRTPSPAPSAHTGFTPSPLRDAMNDVMNSLEGMGMDRRNDVNQHMDGAQDDEMQVWSPEAFDQVYHSTREARPSTSLGFEEVNGQDHVVEEHPLEPNHDYDEQLSSYVSRMERRLTELNRTESVAESNFEASRPQLHFSHQGHGSRPPSSLAHSRPGSAYAQQSRPGSSSGERSRPMSRIGSIGRALSKRGIRERKSAYEVGRDRLARTFTSKSSATTASSTAQSSSTNNSNATSATSQSLMSGYSAGGVSATSAGSFARHKFVPDGFGRPHSVAEVQRPGTAMSGISYRSSQASNARADMSDSRGTAAHMDQGGLLGGLATPVSKKRGIFQRLRDTARTSAASHRSSMGADASGERLSRPKSMLDGLTSISGGRPARSAAQDMGLGGSNSSSGVDWMQVRRDVNRSNSLSKNERNERAERCQMLDIPVLNPVDVLNETAEGDESADGCAVTESTDFSSINLALVDKSARFVTNLPGMVNATSLAQTYLCRQYRSDVQRVRAIFTWVAERISWEDDFDGDVDPRRVIVSRRGCSEEIAVLVAEMCIAVGLHAEVIRGYLKAPGEVFTMQGLGEAAAHPNHWWNAVIVDGEWRMMDCSLASPSNPRRSAYSSAGNQVADGWYFLARPMEFCYTHVPLLPEQQHIVPPLSHDVLLTLPVACPAFFKNGCGMWDFDTSLLHLERLELAHIQIIVPDDTELFAEIESQSFARDADGDYFESGETCRKSALAQAEYLTLPHDPTPLKRYTIKAALPSGPHSGPRGILQVYAGKRGLMHGIHKNPHSLAMVLPLMHDGGENPPYDFFIRHPTPHALRHELYVAGPLCRYLGVNNTFVFSVRQHPAMLAKGGAELSRPVSPSRPTSALSVMRPGSAMSMASASVSGSAYSNPSNSSGMSDGSDGLKNGLSKPAKLAIQSPGGKVIRMTRKVNGMGQKSEEGDVQKAGSSWETIIKIGERGTWRGLVLADRSARWCVFGEWEAR